MSVISSACSPVSGCDTSKIVDLDAQFLRVDGIERVLRVHERRRAAVPLRRGNDGQRERGLARGLGPEYLDHPAARNAADAQRDVETQRSGRDRLHLVGGARVAQAHDGAFAKLFFDLAQRGRQSLLAILFHGESSTNVWRHYFTFSAAPLISYASKSTEFLSRIARCVIQ